MNRTVFFPAIYLILLCQTALPAQENAYFQQKVNYKIDVKLDDEQHFLRGNIQMQYTNNSPNELAVIYFHLWPNAYKNDSTELGKQKERFWGRPPRLNRPSVQGYIDSLNFSVNNAQAKLELDSTHIDIGKLILPRPIKPGKTMTITTPFRVKIPHASISRFGHIGSAYKITQWYPKPAVYDHEGWHTFPYIDMGEFYSEFGSFEVSITLPDDYVVASTGNLQNKDELQRIEQLAAHTAKQIKNNQPLTNPYFNDSTKNTKTLRYKVENVHDFAWFADKNYVALQEKASLPSGKEITCQAFFRNGDQKHWKKATTYIKDALKYYSKWYGEYPYDYCTAIKNPPGARGGGMEYPMITAIGQSNNDALLEIVIMHEVGHNWFYGMLGFNEREHPWLDEGINTFSEIRYMQTKYNDTNLVALALNKFAARAAGVKNFPYRYYHKFSYLNVARFNLDQPAHIRSEAAKPMNYSSIFYSKTGMAVYMLMHYLGEEEFDKIMQSFFQKWQYKHPHPKDFEAHFQKHASKDVSWFFENAIRSDEKVDYKIKKLDGDKLLIKNRKNGILPFPVSGIKNDSVIFTRWYEGFSGKKEVTVPSTKVDELYIDFGESTLDLYGHNHRLKTSGIFKKAEPLSLKLIGAVEQPKQTQINFLPAAGYNYYNTGMLGFYLHSSYFPEKKFNYHLVPLYSIGTNDIVGSGLLSYTHNPQNSWLRKIKITASGKHYNYSREHGKNYNRSQIKSTFDFNNSGAHNRIYQNMNITATRGSDMGNILAGENPTCKNFLNLDYGYRNYELFHPFRAYAGMELSDDYLRATLKLHYTLYLSEKRSHAIKFRLFGGSFLMADNISAPYYFHVNGATGAQDYKYEHTFLGRLEIPGDAGSQPLLSQQFVDNQGGFAAYSPFGRTDQWMIALRAETPVPYLKKVLPVQAYGNFATFGKSKEVPGYTPENYIWEAGVKVSFGNMLEIYFPALMSDFLNKYNKNITENYWQRIRFTLNLNTITRQLL